LQIVLKTPATERAPADWLHIYKPEGGVARGALVRGSSTLATVFAFGVAPFGSATVDGDGKLVIYRFERSRCVVVTTADLDVLRAERDARALCIGTAGYTAGRSQKTTPP
jgi:hypothetical protein